MKKELHILILEDEQRAGEKLLGMAREHAPEATIVWERSVAGGIAFLQRHENVDLILSDIQLLDGDAFSIYETVKPKCPIIFCTAYDQYAMNAFKTNGIGYLLKPYTKEQFDEAWAKYERLFEQKEGISDQVMAALQSALTQRPQSYKSTFAVKKKDGVFLLKVEEVAYFQAQGDFVLAIDTKQGRHAINQSLSQIEAELDPSQFYQINRSEIVNAEHILKFNVYIKNRLAITLAQPNTTLHTSNNRGPAFRQWIENR